MLVGLGNTLNIGTPRLIVMGYAKYNWSTVRKNMAKESILFTVYLTIIVFHNPFFITVK